MKDSAKTKFFNNAETETWEPTKFLLKHFGLCLAFQNPFSDLCGSEAVRRHFVRGRNLISKNVMPGSLGSCGVGRPAPQEDVPNSSPPPPPSTSAPAPPTHPSREGEWIGPEPSTNKPIRLSRLEGAVTEISYSSRLHIYYARPIYGWPASRPCLLLCIVVYVDCIL